MATENKNQYVLITGATMGIGYELAKLFAADGYNLVMVARTELDLENRANELASKYNVDVIPLPKDLFEPQAPFELYDEIKRRGIQIEILVNDAGQGVYGLFVESDIQRQLQIIQLNVASLTALTHLFLQDMVSRNRGKILQLASIVSDLPTPLQSVYGGTKAYVLSFTEALVNELKDTDVSITALQPGATDTDFFNKAGAENSKLTEQVVDPAGVAKDGYKALMKGDAKVVSGLKNKAMSAMSNVIPDTMLADTMRKQSEEKETKSKKK